MPLKLALAYFFVGILWITTSDFLVGYFCEVLKLSDLEDSIQTWKGSFYVSVTALLLYYYLRKRLNSLQKSRSDYKKLFRNHPNPMWIYDTETLSFLAVNKAAIAQYGFSEEQFLRMSIKDIRPREEHDKLEASVSKQERTYSDSGIWVHMKKSGEQFFVNIFSSPAEITHQNARIVSAIDIHEKIMTARQNEELLKQVKINESYLRSLLDTQTTLLLRMDSKGNISFMNKAFREKFSNVEEGDNFFQLTDRSNSEKVRQLLERCRQTPGDPQSFTLSYRPKSRKIDIRWEFIYLIHEDGDGFIQAVGQDVTKQLVFFRKQQAYKKQLDEVLNSVSEMIWSADPKDMRIRFINKACKKVLGYPPNAFYEDADLWYSLILDQDKSKFKASFLNYSESGEREVEYRMRRRDGTVCYIRERSDLHETDSDANKIISCVSTDITRIRQSEKALRATEQRISIILESITDGFFAFDDDYCFTYVNKRTEELLRHRRSSLMGNNVFSYFPENKGAYELLTECSVHKNDTFGEFFFEGINKWLKLSAYATPEGTTVYFQDVTNSVVLRKKIKEDRRNLYALINNTQAFIWSLDRKIQLVTANEAFKEIFMTQHQTPVKEGDHLLEKSENEMIRQRWKGYYEMVLDGRSFKITEELKIGSEAFYTEINFNPILNEQSEVLGASCYGTDITAKRKRLLKIKDQNKRLLEIAWIQSHKLRSPVANILGLLDILKLPGTTETEREFYMQKIEESCLQLNVITEEITEKTIYLDREDEL